MLDPITLEEQITKSRRVLAAWQWMSTISTRPDEVLRLLNTEARSLTTLAIQNPEKAAMVVQLIDGFRKLANTVQNNRRSRPAPRAAIAQPARENALDIC